ncbi:hypothetical protein JYU34_018664, partial [Plutella xylostella]
MNAINHCRAGAQFSFATPARSLHFKQYSTHSQSVSCPAVRTTSGWLDLFPLPCKKRADCTPMGAKHLCCKGFCTKGVKTAAPIR